MTYKPAHFKKCLFNPMEDLLSTPLAELSHDEKLLKYVVALYDPSSPLVHEHRDIKKRKAAAALFAGYPLEDEYTQNLFALKDKGAFEVIFGFLTQHSNSKDWYMITCNEQLFWEYGERILKPINEEKTNIEKDFIAALADKEKLATAQESVSKRIDELYRKMFGEEIDIEMTKPKKRTSPEKMAFQN